MPKQLISILGLVITLGVVALAVTLVALPTWVQSVGVDAQTVSVANTNALYQAQVDGLKEEQERQGEIDASVAQLRTQIPSTNQFDDVFEVIGRAAESAGVSISSATAEAAVPFVERTTAVAPGDEPEAPAADGADGSGADTDSSDQPGGETSVTTEGRQQIDFAIIVIANDMNQATAFLDDLRAGPRLLSSITASTAQAAAGVEVRVSALAFVDTED